MADATATTTTPAAAATPAAADTTAEGKPQTETDWQAKFTAQQKVNRDLETKLNDLRDTQKTQTEAFATALGLKPEETSDVARLAEQVKTLQQTFTETQHQNVVLSVANEHGISADEDLALLKAVKDEATMRSLAARIAKSGEGTGRTPKPDLTQGGNSNPPAASPGDEFAAFLKRQLG